MHLFYGARTIVKHLILNGTKGAYGRILHVERLNWTCFPVHLSLIFLVAGHTLFLGPKESFNSVPDALVWARKDRKHLNCSVIWDTLFFWSFHQVYSCGTLGSAMKQFSPGHACRFMTCLRQHIIGENWTRFIVCDKKLDEITGNISKHLVVFQQT